MPRPDDQPEEALGRLDEALHAFEKSRARTGLNLRPDRSIGEGYRLIAELIGGVLGGVGIGWFVDRLAHTAPWGIAIGVSVGAGISVYMAARTAARMGKQALEKAGPVESVPFDDDED